MGWAWCNCKRLEWSWSSLLLSEFDRAHWEPKIAEAKALEMGVRLSKRHCLQHIIIESDCQMVIQRLAKSAIYLSDLDNILSNILASCRTFSSVLQSDVKRDNNNVAHHLASLVPLGQSKFGKTNILIKWLLTFSWTICPLINSSLVIPSKKKYRVIRL